MIAPGPDGAEGEEFSQEIGEVCAHLGRIAGERTIEGQRNLCNRGRLEKAVPDERGHLVQSVDGLQVSDLAADRHQDRLASDRPSDELFGALIAHVLGQGRHGTGT